jgi:hypothetical protein
MTSIFISYRRDDSAGYAGRLTSDLERLFGDELVFQDIEAIPPGADFVQAIDRAVGASGVLLALIGREWLAAIGPTGRRRLDDPQDFVRAEIAAALRRGIVVIPVLVEGATMPGPDQLPDDLAPLTRRQAIELSDSRWSYDVSLLAATLRRVLGAATDPAGRVDVQGASRPGRRRHLALAAGALLLAAGGVGVALWPRTPDVSGRWDLPDGSYWIIQQEARTLRVDETHHDSKQVWKRGTGTVEGASVRLELGLVFGGPYRYQARLKISPDRRIMTGMLRELTTGQESPLSVSRR